MVKSYGCELEQYLKVSLIEGLALLFTSFSVPCRFTINVHMSINEFAIEKRDAKRRTDYILDNNSLKEMICRRTRDKIFLTKNKQRNKKARELHR